MTVQRIALLGAGAQAASASTPWTPALMQTQLWNKASDLSTLVTVDGALAQWADKSGFSRTAVQSTAASRPVPLVVAGLNVIRFDGVDDFMTINSAFFPSGPPSEVSFMIAAVVQENNGGFGGVITSNPGSTENSGCGLLINSNRTFSMFPSNDAVKTAATTGRAIITGVTAAGTTSIFVNGSLAATAPYASNVVNGPATALGRYRVADSNFGGLDLHELVVAFTTSATTRQRLEGYMAWEPGVGLQLSLPANHPHRTAAPTA